MKENIFPKRHGKKGDDDGGKIGLIFTYILSEKKRKGQSSVLGRGTPWTPSHFFHVLLVSPQDKQNRKMQRRALT